MLLDRADETTWISKARSVACDELNGDRAAFVIISHDRRSYANWTRATLLGRSGRCPSSGYRFRAGSKLARPRCGKKRTCQRHKLEPARSSRKRGGLVEVFSGGASATRPALRALARLRVQNVPASLSVRAQAACRLRQGQSLAKGGRGHCITKAYGDKTILRPVLISRSAAGTALLWSGQTVWVKPTLLNMLIGKSKLTAVGDQARHQPRDCLFDQARGASSTGYDLWTV